MARYYFLAFTLLISILKHIYAQETDTEIQSLSNFIKPAIPDKYNDAVSESSRYNQKPEPGGSIVIRIPIDPKSLNPITDNGAQSNLINSYIFDSLIRQDSETFEWLPWIAESWEERDQIFLKDETVLEGKIIQQTDEKIYFAENKGKIVIGKHDAVSYDIPTGTVILKNGTTLKGQLKEYHYTIHIEPLSNSISRIINLSDIKDRPEALTKKALLLNNIYIFTVRRGVKWHDGKECTVDDILFSYEAIRNKYVDAAPLRSYYNDVENVTIIDNDTIKFVYSKSYFKSLNLCGGMTIIPKHIYTPERYAGDAESFGSAFNAHEANRHPIGNGPYTFLKWEKGKEIVVTKTPDYWASQCNLPYWDKDQPYLEKITWTIINNKTAAVKELQNGVVDADFDVEPDTWFSEQTNTPNFTQTFARADITVPLYTYIGWNADTPYFKDPNVRTAMTHLIPRETIAREIHQGLVEEVTGPFFIDGPIYDHSLTPLGHSLKKAKQLLRKAGWVDHDGDGVIDKDGIPFEFEYLIHNARDYHQKIADIIKESIEKAGIKMIIRKIDWTIFSETVSDRKFDAVRFAWGTGIDDDPYQIWHSSQKENRGSNYVGYNNPAVDRILENARETFDPIERWSLYREMHHILYNEQPYTFLFCFKTLVFYNKNFRNVKFYSTRPGYNLTEWYIPQENPEAKPE
ncbi:hypothetical protein KDK77_09465 [bacterium]|nr:hypothetical protein [bacterium]